jgi:hypothetical protein
MTGPVLKNLIFLEILIVVGGLFFHMASTRGTRRDVGSLPAIVMALTSGSAFLSPKLVIVHIAIGLIPLIFGRTKLKVGMIVAMGMFAIPALPTDLFIGGAWLFPWTIQSTLAVTGLMAFLIAPGRIPRAPVFADITLIVVTAVLIVIDARGGAWIGFLRQLVYYIFVYAIPVFIVTRSARNAVEWRTLLTSMAGLGVILAVIVLYEARSDWPLYSPIMSHFDFAVGVVVKWRGGLMRAYGPMGEATQMGCVLVICFTAALAVRRSFISNIAYIAIVGVIALGTLAPQSRGGMIGIAVALVVSSFYRRGISGMGQVGGAALLLSGAYTAATLIGSIGSQISNSLNEASSGNYRSELLRRGLQEFWKSPIYGDSFINVVERMQDMVQGEHMVDFVNTYLYVALFAGAIGLVAFCVANIIPIVRLIQIRRRLPPGSPERDVAGFCLALLVSAAGMIGFTSYMQRPSTFFLIAASMALMVSVPRRVGAAKRSSNLRVSRSVDPLNV